MKTSTPSLFPVLDNRPIDQWRVTELKEELKRRKLTTKGLKDDLVKRLDEALRNEYEAAEGDEGNNLEGSPQPVIHTGDVKIIDGTPQPLVDTEDIAVLDIASKPIAQTEDIAVLDVASKPVAQTEEVLDVGSKPVAQTEDIGVLDGTHRPVTNAEDTEAPVNYEKFEGMMHHGNNADEMNVGMIDETALFPSKRDIQEGLVTDGADSVRIEETVVHVTSVETTVVVKESVTHEIAVNEQESPKNDVQSVRDDLNIRLEDEERGPPYEDVELKSSDPSHQASEVSAVIGFQVTKLESEETKPPYNDVELNSSDPINQVQVSEVNTVLGFQVKCDSISSDCVSINEKNELKDNIIADYVKLEVDVKPEIVHPSSSNVLSDGSKLHPMDVEEPYENKEQERDDKTANAEMSKKLDSLDVVSSEKLNLDRSSGDDSMEDDTLDNKPIDSKYNLEEVRDQGEKNEDQVMGEEAPIDIVSDDIPTDKKDIHDEIKNVPAAPIVKRKLHDQEVGNNEISKRQRRWNSENLKVPEPQINIASSTTPKDMFPSTTLKRNFSRSDSSASEDAHKERVVPPSPKPPTTSLRIDRFLRPFTLKAVQELLGKTGSVISFWMDHIKTHCYVTYSSVEEAVETRNAVYNLQWPPNGGRLLLAEFVDPQEVKLRVEAPPQSPATPVSTTPTMPPPPPPTVQPQAPPRQQIQKQTLPPPPPLPLPPPPPLSNPPQARERLPPPPPPPEKIDPPIVTLDDLFRKTKATPRIYYLPLSDEQVAAKLKQQQQGRNTKQ